jgi:heme oxygenase
MITERLKAETADHHKATEAVSFGDRIMGGSLTLEEYGLLIEKNYILHAVLEAALTESNLIPEELELTARAKTKSLEADMTLLERPFPVLPVPAISYKTAAEALGAMYVLEGATLGGAYIYKALQRNPVIAPLGEFNYYTVYGDKIGPNWKAFQEGLLKHVNTKEQEDEAIESAKQTFDFFKEIFLKQEASNS